MAFMQQFEAHLAKPVGDATDEDPLDTHVRRLLVVLEEKTSTPRHMVACGVAGVIALLLVVGGDSANIVCNVVTVLYPFYVVALAYQRQMGEGALRPLNQEQLNGLMADLSGRLWLTVFGVAYIVLLVLDDPLSETFKGLYWLVKFAALMYLQWVWPLTGAEQPVVVKEEPPVVVSSVPSTAPPPVERPTPPPPPPPQPPIVQPETLPENANKDVWLEQSAGGSWSDIRCPIMALGRPLRVAPGVEEEQFVALWYKHGKPCSGAVTNVNGKIAAEFVSHGVVHRKHEQVQDLQVLAYNPAYAEYKISWQPYRIAYNADSPWYAVRVDDTAPCVVTHSGGLERLGKVQLKEEQASIACHNSDLPLRFMGGQVQEFMVSEGTLTFKTSSTNNQPTNHTADLSMPQSPSPQSQGRNGPMRSPTKCVGIDVPLWRIDLDANNNMEHIVVQRKDHPTLKGPGKHLKAPPARRHSVTQTYEEEVDRVGKIEEMCRPLEVSDDKLRKLMALLLQQMNEGLAMETAHTATVRMLPSYVTGVPDGSEQGNYLALDLGGTNFRVLLIRLEGSKAEMTGKIYRISHELMTGGGDALFDHIAECMARFSEANGLTGRLPLGFTFSFPCEQHGLTAATLINWTKGFTAADVEGQDVVQMLKAAVKRRRDVEIDVVALLNDTTGTLMACAYMENTCNVGVIVGTGTNACYMERLERIGKLDPAVDHGYDATADEMCINTEWGAFGSDGAMDFIRTTFDRHIDAASVNPGKQIFEKMISGMYMGELVRLVLVALVDAHLLFHESSTVGNLRESGGFPTKYVSEVEGDVEGESYSKTFEIVEDMGVEGATLTDCANIAYVCSVVSTRAAYLCAMGIATLLNRMAKKFVTVGIDGSVYRFHPTFKLLLDQKVGQLVDKGVDFQLMLSEDGSGKGAALVAAVASRQKP